MPLPLALDYTLMHMYMLKPLQRFLNTCEFTPDDRVLDLGCGVGWSAGVAITKGVAKVTVVDRHPELIVAALNYLHGPNFHTFPAAVESACGDITSKDFLRQFRATQTRPGFTKILALNILHMVAREHPDLSMAVMVRDLAKLLAPGGRLIFNIDHPGTFVSNLVYTRFYQAFSDPYKYETLHVKDVSSEHGINQTVAYGRSFIEQVNQLPGPTRLETVSFTRYTDLAATYPASLCQQIRRSLEDDCRAQRARTGQTTQPSAADLESYVQQWILDQERFTVPINIAHDNESVGMTLEKIG